MWPGYRPQERREFDPRQTGHCGAQKEAEGGAESQEALSMRNREHRGEQKPRVPETQGGAPLSLLKSARPTNAVQKNQKAGKVNRAASRTNTICVVDKSRICFTLYPQIDTVA